VRAFEQSSGLPRDQLRLWLACHEVIRQRLLTGVPWLKDHLYRLVNEMAALTEPDPSGLMDRLQTLDMSRPESIQELLEGGEGLSGPPSPALQAATARLEVLLALAGGYALVLSERVLAGRLPALQSIQSVVRARMADEDGAHALYAQLLRADPERAAATVGERFCREVLAATDVDGLDRVWAHPDFLPTPDELASPGGWLERAGLVGGEEISLDEGLRALLEGGVSGKPPSGEAAPGEAGESGESPEGGAEGSRGTGDQPGGTRPQGSGDTGAQEGSGEPRRPEDPGGQ
jgi:putative hydrolase